MQTRSALLNVMTAAAQKAARSLVRDFGEIENLQVSKKGPADFVSNAELPNAACPDFPTLIESSDTQGVQICDGRVGYLTLIPADTAGQLFASIEKPDPTVSGVGVTGAVVLSDASQLPEVDPAALAC